MHVESFTGSIKLADAALGALRDDLTAAADNAARLELLARRKDGVTFTCAQLKALCQVRRKFMASGRVAEEPPRATPEPRVGQHTS